jgi:vacuolar-type H+-ATPase subunit I/STV1
MPGLARFAALFLDSLSTMEATINPNDTTDPDTQSAIDVVDTFSMAASDLDAVQSVVSEVKIELDESPHADRLHTAAQALQRVINDLEDSQDTAEELLDPLR